MQTLYVHCTRNECFEKGHNNPWASFYWSPEGRTEEGGDGEEETKELDQKEVERLRRKYASAAAGEGKPKVLVRTFQEILKGVGYETSN